MGKGNKSDYPVESRRPIVPPVNFTPGPPGVFQRDLGARMNRHSEKAGEATGGEAERLKARFTMPVLVAASEAIRNFVANAAPTPGGPPLPAPVAPLQPPPRPQPLPRPQPPPDRGTVPAAPPEPIPHPQPLPGPRPHSRNRCPGIKAAADASLVTSMNHWWQNWPKTHAYIAGTMCFPTCWRTATSVILA